MVEMTAGVPMEALLAVMANAGAAVMEVVGGKPATMAAAIQARAAGPNAEAIMLVLMVVLMVERAAAAIAQLVQVD